jgi:hypothetical protein
MRKLIVIGAAIAALAIVPVAGANPFAGAQAAGSNPTSNNAIGFCVAAGTANYQAAGFTTGDNRSFLKGGTNELIAAARLSCTPELQAWYAGLDTPIPVTAP